MAVLQFSKNSEFHAQCLSSPKFFPIPTSEVFYTRSDCEYLYTPVDTFFPSGSNVKQKNGVQGEDSSSPEGLSYLGVILMLDVWLPSILVANTS